MFPKEGRFVNAKRLKIIRNDDVFSGLDDKSVVEAGYSGGIWLSFENKRVLPLYAKKERVEARFQTAGQRRTADNRTGLTSKCECWKWHCLLVRSDGVLIQTKESIDVMLHTRIRSIRYAYISEKCWVCHHGILAHGHCTTLPKLSQRSSIITTLFAGVIEVLYIFLYGSVQQPSPFELIISLTALVAQGISITAFGTSGLLVLLAEFASCVSLALGGLIATEGQLSLHVTVLLSFFSGHSLTSSRSRINSMPPVTWTRMLASSQSGSPLLEHAVFYAYWGSDVLLLEDDIVEKNILRRLLDPSAGTRARNSYSWASCFSSRICSSWLPYWDWTSSQQKARWLYFFGSVQVFVSAALSGDWRCECRFSSGD